MSPITRTRVLLVIASAIVLACTAPPAVPAEQSPLPVSALPDLGSPFPPAQGSAHLEMTGPSQLSPSRLVRLQDSVFTVAVSTHGHVSFIATSAPSFSTPEGVRVGTPYSAVRTLVGSEPICELGWGCYSRLPSGWHAAFPFSDAVNGQTLPSNAVVRWLFKR